MFVKFEKKKKKKKSDVTRERISDELLYTVLATRYGPQSVASARWHTESFCFKFEALDSESFEF